METVYLWSAIVGGGLLLVQTTMMLTGLGGDVELDADVGDLDFDVDVDGDVGGDGEAGEIGHGNVFVNALGVRTLVAFLTFFGLAGMAAREASLSQGATLAVAMAAGATAFVIVAYVMSLLAGLHSSGNVNLRNAVGAEGSVYLNVPGHHEGQGKVTVEVQNRRHECKAVTGGGPIPTGAEIKVVGLRGTDTLEVIPLSEGI